jgi:16S rRNA U516 pseudouridylate synthase RsuA-like enzyme
VRVAIGPLPLGELEKGKVRPLRAKEKTALDGAIAAHGQPR